MRVPPWCHILLTTNNILYQTSILQDCKVVNIMTVKLLMSYDKGQDNKIENELILYL